MQLGLDLLHAQKRHKLHSTPQAQPMQFSMSFVSPFQDYFLMKCMYSILDMMALAVRKD